VLRPGASRPHDDVIFRNQLAAAKAAQAVAAAPAALISLVVYQSIHIRSNQPQQPSGRTGHTTV
jgi:hypothetical protein